MKKIVAVLVLIIAIGCIALAGLGEKDTAQTEYLRIHIRANSNSEEDQSVKYKVRDAVVTYLTPTVAECGDKQAAYAAGDTWGLPSSCWRLVRTSMPRTRMGERIRVRRKGEPSAGEVPDPRLRGRDARSGRVRRAHFGARLGRRG